LKFHLIKIRFPTRFSFKSDMWRRVTSEETPLRVTSCTSDLMSWRWYDDTYGYNDHSVIKIDGTH